MYLIFQNSYLNIVTKTIKLNKICNLVLEIKNYIQCYAYIICFLVLCS